MAKDVTLADIAQKVGVSNVAVSKALAGKPGVSDELRQKIKSIADELGYISSTVTRQTKAETGNIGVVIPENYYGFSVSFFGKLYECVVKALYDNRYYGILELLTIQDEKEGNMPKIMRDEKVDGVIFLGQLDKAYTIKMAEQAEIPVFFLDTYASVDGIDAVISDGYYGTYQMTNYLIQSGHKNIAYVGSVDATSSIADRYWGYRKALRENNIEFRMEWEIPDRDEKGKTYEKILDFKGDVDAYVCNCDYTAHRLIGNLQSEGFEVPQDVSIVGFDNFVPVGMDCSHITTYDVDMDKMSDICVRSLINKIKNEPYVKGIQVVTGKIIEKGSVKRYI